MTAMPALAAQTATASLGAVMGKSKTGRAPSVPSKASVPSKDGLDQIAAPGAPTALDPKARARAQATDFEAMFLHSMFSQMFTGIDGEGPFGGAGGPGVWRSFLSDEYAKSFAKAGGIGIADHVYRALLAQQEARVH
jgi:Rod binding domain-containing protein